jgi:hypothetical protein
MKKEFKISPSYRNHQSSRTNYQFLVIALVVVVLVAVEVS